MDGICKTCGKNEGEFISFKNSKGECCLMCYDCIRCISHLPELVHTYNLVNNLFKR